MNRQLRCHGDDGATCSWTGRGLCVQCTAMGNMKVAEARARFGEVLDAAEKGLPVIIERRGVRFRVVAEAARRGQAPDEAVFDFVDPAVSTGQWTWRANATKGLLFAARRKRR